MKIYFSTESCFGILIDNVKYTFEFEGDLLRAERKVPGSEYGELIEHHITNGTIVPVAITCSLLVRAMKVTVFYLF